MWCGVAWRFIAYMCVREDEGKQEKENERAERKRGDGLYCTEIFWKRIFCWCHMLIDSLVRMRDYSMRREMGIFLTPSLNVTTLSQNVYFASNGVLNQRSFYIVSCFFLKTYPLHPMPPEFIIHSITVNH